MFRRFVLVASLPQQLRQPCDVDGDPSRLLAIRNPSIENDNDATTTVSLFGASFLGDITAKL
jgi:hypothetical protein